MPWVPRPHRGWREIVRGASQVDHRQCTEQQRQGQPCPSRLARRDPSFNGRDSGTHDSNTLRGCGHRYRDSRVRALPLRVTTTDRPAVPPVDRDQCRRLSSTSSCCVYPNIYEYRDIDVMSITTALVSWLTHAESSCDTLSHHRAHCAAGCRLFLRVPGRRKAASPPAVSLSRLRRLTHCVLAEVCENL